MQLLHDFKRFIRTKCGVAAFLVIFGCAMLLALFIGRTFILPLPLSYTLDFRGANWIQNIHTAPLRPAYFRKSLFIAGKVEEAWIQLSATGHYKLLVDGVLIDENTYPGVRVAGVYDLQPVLTAGRNVIAIYVTAGEFPGPTQVLVRGAYKTSGAPPREFQSDSSWKVSETPDGIVGGLAWSSQYLDDSLWSNAAEAQPKELASTVQPVLFDPEVVRRAPHAWWITGTNRSWLEASFQYRFRVPFIHEEIWLRIAANGAYDVIVNGYLAIREPSERRIRRQRPVTPVVGGLQIATSTNDLAGPIYPDSSAPGSQTPATLEAKLLNLEILPLMAPRERAATILATQPDSLANSAAFAAIAPPVEHVVQRGKPDGSLTAIATTPLLVAYNITRFTKAGENTLSISVHSENGPPVLLADGRINSKGRALTFATGDKWTVPESGGRLSQPSVAASVVGSYLDMPWGPLPKVLSTGDSEPIELLRVIVTRAALGIGVVLAALCLWLSTPLMRLGAARRLRPRVWINDALFQMPLLTILVGSSFLSYDVRLRPEAFYNARFILFVAMALALAKSGSLLWPVNQATRHRKLPYPRNYIYAGIALMLVVLAGFAVRAAGLLDTSFGHDEASMARFSIGVLDRGFPYVRNGSYTKWLTTYELVPYFLAMSSLAFGRSVLAYRVPALLFGTATIWLVGVAGSRMFDRRTGLLAALVYAFLPSAVLWSRDGFYPSQECFFALLTYLCFFEACRNPGVLNRRFLAATGMSFLLTYLSWEGSGFILPSLFLMLIVMSLPSWSWVRDRAVWLIGMGVTMIVVLQLCNRQLLLIPDYVGVGFDLSEVSTPALVFLNRTIFNPFYYVRNFYLTDNHAVLSFLLLLSVSMWRSNRGLLYCGMMLVSLTFWYSLFLPHYAARYMFQAQPLLVLGGAGAAFLIKDRLHELVGASGSVLPSTLGKMCSAAAVALVLLSANPYILKLYRFGSDGSTPGYFERSGVEFKAAYRDADLYVARNLRKGDVIVTREPHVFAFYTGIDPAYSMNTLWNSRVFYDGGDAGRRYIDKWYGLVSLMSLRELLAVRAAHHRVWIIRSAGCRREFDYNDLSFLNKWARTEFETACEEVMLLNGVP
jgi:hypothetical protein